MTSKALAKAEPKELATVDYGEFADDALAVNGREDVSLPFIYILQPLSPQVADGLVEGAKPGQFFNSVTGDLMDSVNFVWAYDEVKYVEWKPRDAGGGIVDTYDPGDPVVRDAKANQQGYGKLKIGENDLVETRYIYGLVLDDDFNIISIGVIAAKSTALKPAKDWRTSLMMQGKGIPSYAFVTKLTSAKQKNDSGIWYNLVARPFGDSYKTTGRLTPQNHLDILREAKSFKEMIQLGEAKVDHSAEAAHSKSSTSAAKVDDEVPF